MASSKSKTKQIRPTMLLVAQNIIISEVIQSRVCTNPTVVAEYAAAMERGDRFPPIIVFYDPRQDVYFVVDGFHRLLAHLRARTNEQIQAEVCLGTEQDALWFSIAANKVHGLQRTNDDKRKAVELALLHTNGSTMSNRHIAAYVGVTHPTVQRIRETLEYAGKLSKNARRTGADGRAYCILKNGEQPIVDCTCGACVHYEWTHCIIEGVVRESTDQVCEEFIGREKEEPDTVEDMAPVVRDPDGGGEYAPKEVRRRVSRRKSGECIPIPLPRANVDLAAVVIRHYLGDTYAATLGQALAKLTRESFD